MGQPNRTIRLIDVLAARTARSVSVNADVGFGDSDIDAIRDLGRYIDGRKARLPFSLRVEWADPDQPVRAGFALQIPVGHGTANCNRGAVNSSLVVVVAVEQCDRILIFLSPSGVHPQHHLGPIVGIGAAVAGVDREDRAGAVVGAAQQRLQFQLFDLLFQPSQLRPPPRLQATDLPRPFQALRKDPRQPEQTGPKVPRPP